MSETPPATASGASTPSSSAADQARIRKERREAKIRAGGSARLNKITGLGGGVQRDPSPAQSSPSAKVDHSADPEEVDISEHFYQPASNSRLRNPQTPPFQAQQQFSDDQLRALMLGDAMPPQDGQPPFPQNPFAGFPGMDPSSFGGQPGEEDPMMKMLQQMMGGMGAAPPGAGEGFPGMAGFPGMPGMGMGDANPQTAALGDPYAYVWRIVHAVFALGLGLYIAFTTSFSGTKVEREMSGLDSTIATTTNGNIKFFYIFATVEVLLQTSRFFLEKGQVQPGGIMGMILNFLPHPWKGYVNIVLRYGRIWTTVSADAMACVFVLGVCCWLRDV